jgi:hypothetical protein
MAAPQPEPLATPATAVAVSSWSALPALPTKKRGRPRKQPSVEALAVARLKPEHRLIAECRAKAMKPTAIARLLDCSPATVRGALKLPDVKIALGFYQQTLHEKAMAAKNLAANQLPRALQKVADEIEKPGTEPRHLINAAQMFAKVSGAQSDGQQGDRVQQKVVFNIQGDSEAARQLSRTFSAGLDAGEEPADIEWEAVTPEPAESAEAGESEE